MELGSVRNKTTKLVEQMANSFKKSSSNYLLSEEQVNSILELRLQKLTAYGIGEIETELNKLSTLIIEYNKILNSKKELYNLKSLS